MDKLTNAVPSVGRIDLAREPDFVLGCLRVRPSRLELVGGGGERRSLQPRVMQVLVALAYTECEVVSQKELISRCWSGLSVSEDAIGRCIGQLRRLAETWPAPPFAIETIPGVGYRLESLSGGASAGAVEGPRTPSARPGRRWAWVVAAIVLVTAVTIATWRLVGGPAKVAPSIPFPTVAVTPFQPADSSPAAKALAATLTSEVSDAMSHYNLVVIEPAPTQVKAQASPASAPAADFLVSGRIVPKGAGSTITNDLVDAHQGIVVFSFDTPSPSGSRGDVASAIAGRIAHALDPTKLTNDLAGKLSPSDYTLIARTNEAIDRWDTADALGLNQALANRHPGDGDLQASTAISAIYAAQAAPPADRPALIRLARLSMAKAERLSSTSALLYNARQLFLGGPLSYAAQERELRRAVALDPNLHVTFNALGEVMLSVGRTKEGVGLITRSIQLDPMSLVVVGMGIHDFAEAGASDEANDALKRLETVWPDEVEGARHARYEIAFYTGAPREVLAVVGESPGPIHHSIPATQRDAMLRALTASDRGAVRRMVAECFANYGRSGGQVADPECLFEMVERGDLDDAFRFAELAYPDHRHLYPLGADGWLINPPLGLDPVGLFTPKMKPFRDDPRFWDVALRSGLVDYWRSTGAWPDDCQNQLAVCQARAAAARARDRAVPARR